MESISSRHIEALAAQLQGLIERTARYRQPVYYRSEVDEEPRMVYKSLQFRIE